MKCRLVNDNDDGEEYETLFVGTIECDPEECQVIMHKGQAFVYDGTEDEGESASYIVTKVAEFTEGKD